MRLWYQSASSYRYEETWELYGKTLEEQCKRAASPDTEIYVTGLPVMMREIDRYKSITYFHKAQILKNMLKAEEEGYDVFVIGCTTDTGLEEGREMLKIPVVGISQASYYLAGMLGELFAVVSISAHFCEKYRQQIVRYGMESKHLRGNYYFPATEEEVALALKEPGPIMEKFKVVAQRAIDDGASVIIPSPAFLATAAFKTGLTKLNDVLVLDTISSLIKTGEMLAGLNNVGVTVSRKLNVYGYLGKELRQETFDKYRMVFRID